jgi:uncharacterized protein (TIGR02147 family)
MTQPTFNIYSYNDWQVFLRDWIELRRLADPSVSLQSLAFRLGLKAKSHLHRLLNSPGKTLAPHLVEPLAKIMKLEAGEADYWEAMVSMARASSLEERNKQYLRLHKLRGVRKPADIRIDQSEYFATWYLPMLREAVMLEGWNGDFAKLARGFEPALTETQARRGTELLIRLQLLRQNGDGRYEQVDPLVSTQSHAREMAVASFQREMLHLGERALQTIIPERREVSTVTFSIPKSAFPRMQELMRQFQEQLARESMEVPGTHDSVFQLNLQCFPVVTKPTKEKNS